MLRISSIRGLTAIVWLVVVLMAGCSRTQEAASQVEASTTGLSRDVVAPTSAPMEAPESRAPFDAPARVLVGWEAQTGLRPASQAPGAPPPEDVWQSRIRAACDAPIWKQAAARRLAEQYVAEDGGDTASTRLLEDAAESLWLIAVQVCRDDFPQDAIDRGPSFAFSP